MLNICMERRRLRETGGAPIPFGADQTTAKPNKEGESDEEFFDCNDEAEETENSKPNDTPVGRLSKLGSMLLVNHDEPLYIPVTQEPVPKTEDQVEDDAQVMLNLGPESDLRVQMMSASLCSDMESFKAANPLATLEDFIRWYSPRDWIEEDCDERDPFGRKGHLSERMMLPGNTWQVTWEQARAVPAHRQRRLFDDTKEAEKVLHFLESVTIGQICQMTIGCLFHAVILRLIEEETYYSGIVPNWKDSIDKVLQQCCRLSRDAWISPSKTGTSKEKWALLLNDITQLEYSITQARSLKMKLAPDVVELQDQHKTVLSSLIKCLETELQNGSKNEMSISVLNMFGEVKHAQTELKYEQCEDNLVLPSPVEKQFTLRLSGKMVHKGVGGPQFLR